ncbi:hypothetical protein CBR_g48316 [Chara braunii]|uniref:Myb/SANT-like DNA-binding domain-containing protein n=1 Tax=Chara braunii TaxID=69332 RepID=A0A388K459_CHABU|nr:hypothetical protein CBR_g48316 [Chara braunii]|eukprot:GBG64848.1 hypothetical protein CBR_g48316 [Chara braunii]
MGIGDVVGTQFEGDRYRASPSAQSWHYIDDPPSTPVPQTHGGVHPSNNRPSLAMPMTDVLSDGGRGAYPTTVYEFGTQQGSSGTYGQCAPQPRVRGAPTRTESPRWGCGPEHSVQASQHRLQGLPPLSPPLTRRTTTMGEDNTPGQARVQQTAISAAGTRKDGGPACGADMGSEEEQQQPGIAEHIADQLQRPRVVLPTAGEGRSAASPSAASAGEKRKAPKPAPPAKKNTIWTLEERVLLAKISGEDDALMADAEGAHQRMTRGRRYDWIADRMKEEGYTCTGENCRKKWAELTKKVKEIRDACDGSDKPTYWEITTEERKKLGISMTFERPLWDVMEWFRTKAAFVMSNTMASEEFRPGGCTTVNDADSEGTGTEASDSAAKTRRTSSGFAAVDLEVALGFNKRLLSHFLLWVKKTGDAVPDNWADLEVDIVGDIVTCFIDNLAMEHASRLDMGPFYHTFMVPLLSAAAISMARFGCEIVRRYGVAPRVSAACDRSGRRNRIRWID